MKTSTKTTAQLKALQTKAQKTADQLNQEVMAVAVSIKENGAVSEDGNIQYNGDTNRSDIYYVDIMNGAPGQITTDTDWGGTNTKTIANSAGNGAGAQLILAEETMAWDDGKVYEIGSGTVIYA